MFKVKYSCISHVGKCRKTNQDNYILCDGRYAKPEETYAYPLTGSFTQDGASIIGVFDGMGGEECGEVASLIAAEEASRLPAGEAPMSVLYDYCMSVNESICRYADEHALCSMGTTAALLAFGKREVTLCNIGDTKIFRLSGNKLRQISKDHLAAAAYGIKPQLYQNLGIPVDEMKIEPYFAQGKYRDGDIYLICSDGLTDMLNNDEIAKILTETDFEDAAKKLTEVSLEHGGRDNVTVILCEIEERVGLLRGFFKRGTLKRRVQL